MSGAFGALVFDDWDSPDITAGTVVRYEQLLDLSDMCDAELLDDDGVWFCTRFHLGQPGQHVATDLPDVHDRTAEVTAVWTSRPTLTIAAGETS